MIDRLIYNAQIYTGDESRSEITAIAIMGEKIVAVGSDNDLLLLADAETQLDNAGGRFVMAGLTDAHIHWENTAKMQQAVNLMLAPSLAEALHRLQNHLSHLAGGEWLLGYGWTQDSWEDNGRRFPTKADLDTLTGDIPAYLTAKSLHAAWVNSAALRLAGITRNTPDPDGGKISRDEHGDPDGILLEPAAMRLVWEHIPEPDPDRLTQWMKDLQVEAWSYGLTGIHDFDNPSCLVALQKLRENGDLGLRVVKQINLAWIEQAHALGLRAGFGDDWLRIGALKLFADGALGAKTATMLQPYNGEPDNYGVEVLSQATMLELVSRASRLGLPTSIHAIGDRAVREVLNVFEAVRAEESAAGIPRLARRHRMEHVQIIHPDDRHRLGQLGIVASMQPIHAASDWHMADRYWGERARYSYAWRTQQQAGAVLAFGSDAPVDHFDTRQGIYAAVTRRDMTHQPPEGWYPEEKLTLGETLRAYTVGSAYAGGMETRLGKLQTGYLADLIVLDRNPFEAEPEAILEMEFLGTMVGGNWKRKLFD